MREGINNGNYKHGMQKTKIYKSWQHLKERCDNSNCKSYKNYGGRGITYNNKWKNFLGFYEDMGDSYKEGLTIDRIDVNGNYCKENCSWITKGKQTENTRRTVYIYFKGARVKLLDLAKKYDIKYKLLYYRIFTYGLSIEDALVKGDRRGKWERT